MEKSLIKIVIFMMLAGANLSLYCQTDEKPENENIIHQLGISVHPGYIFQTSSFFKRDNVAGVRQQKSFSAHLKYAFRFAETSFYGRNYPNTYQGVGISYNSFYNKTEIGNPVALYVFQGSRIASLGKRLSFDYEWNFGASFGWVPYDEYTNFYNTVVGSEINAYINLGFFLNWKLSRNWLVTAGISASHYSNGNTRYPNGGVNDVSTRIGLTHLFGGGLPDNKKPDCESARADKCRYPQVDLIVYGAVRAKGIRSESYIVPSRFAIAGMNINPMYNFGRYFRGGFSIDAQYDESANIEEHIADTRENDRLLFYRPSFGEQFGVGLSLRAEFVMPIFSINLGIGHNVFYKGDALKGLYQIAVLKTNITKNLYLHTGYKLSKFYDPNNLMIGLGYRFR